MKKSNIYQAIFKTLVYSDVFGSPLSFSEIHRYLYRYKTSKFELKEALNSSPFLQKKGRYYFIGGRERILAGHSLRLRESERKLRIAKDAVEILKRIPTIQMSGISGSVAVKNATKDADIDLFIITREHSLWSTRILVTLIIRLMRKKRIPGMVMAPDAICTNMWMSANHLPLPQKNLFLAREISQLQVLFNRNDTYNTFLAENLWVRNYLPNISAAKIHTGGSRWNAIDTILFLINIFAFITQKLYMKKKQTSERVSLHYAAFHPKDISRIVLQTYASRIREYSPQKSKILRTLPDVYRITPGS